MMSPNYDKLRSVLDAAFHQSAEGKGRDRHANGRDFDRQPILEIARMVGPGYQAGQAMKKCQEAMGMVARGEPDAAVQELLGAIVYTAACVVLIQEMKAQVAPVRREAYTPAPPVNVQRPPAPASNALREAMQAVEREVGPKDRY